MTYYTVLILLTERYGTHTRKRPAVSSFGVWRLPERALMSNSHRGLKTADDKSVSKCDKRSWMEQSRRGRVRNWLQIVGNALNTIRGHALFTKPYIYPVDNTDGSIMWTGDTDAPSSTVQPNSWLNRNEGSGLSARVLPHANAHSQTNARTEPNRDTANAMTTLAPDK